MRDSSTMRWSQRTARATAPVELIWANLQAHSDSTEAQTKAYFSDKTQKSLVGVHKESTKFMTLLLGEGLAVVPHKRFKESGTNCCHDQTSPIASGIKEAVGACTARCNLHWETINQKDNVTCARKGAPLIPVELATNFVKLV